MRHFITNIALFCLLIAISPDSVRGLNIDSSVQMEADTVTVYVLGTSTDSRFEPEVVKVRPGDVVTFIVKEGVHTVTAYHPDNRRDLAIPQGAESFDSGILAAGNEWFLTITHEGEYNYFCMPHERLGHKGKIISNASITLLKEEHTSEKN
jgi:plastocyanin